MIKTELTNRNIVSMEPIPVPIELTREIPNPNPDLVVRTRQEIRDILHGKDKRRLLMVVGPCSIHDTVAAIEYAERLASLKDHTEDDLLLVMRTYVEKPRTTKGWKGPMDDPNLDGSVDDDGLTFSRQILAKVNSLGLSTAMEFLNDLNPNYLTDLVSWGAIGARTVESQPHRELVSGLSMPVGFKNSTEGNIMVAVDAMEAAASPHAFDNIDEYGRPCRIRSTGNIDTHVVLRGSNHSTNYDETSVNKTLSLIDKRHLLEECSRPVMIDSSHGNSNKDFRKQSHVVRNVLDQIQNGQNRIMGLMIESNLNEGQQKWIAGQPLKYGVSITDSCIGWEETEHLLLECAKSIQPKRFAIA